MRIFHLSSTTDEFTTVTIARYSAAQPLPTSASSFTLVDRWEIPIAAVSSLSAAGSTSGKLADLTS